MIITFIYKNITENFNDFTDVYQNYFLFPITSKNLH